MPSLSKTHESGRCMPVLYVKNGSSLTFGSRRTRAIDSILSIVTVLATHPSLIVADANAASLLRKPVPCDGRSSIGSDDRMPPYGDGLLRATPLVMRKTHGRALPNGNVPAIDWHRMNGFDRSECYKCGFSGIAKRKVFAPFFVQDAVGPEATEDG